MWISGELPPIHHQGTKRSVFLGARTTRYDLAQFDLEMLYGRVCLRIDGKVPLNKLLCLLGCIHMNYRLAAVEVGDLLKYDTTVNQINRIAQAIFQFPQETFPNDSITSLRAKTIHDWILTLAKQRMDPSERNNKLISFCRQICPQQLHEALDKILESSGASNSSINKELLAEFSSRSFHAEITKHSKVLFLQGHYFHAIFEACKVYNKQVQAKSMSLKDGQALMLDVWGGGLRCFKNHTMPI